jgi:hypothetical protein
LDADALLAGKLRYLDDREDERSTKSCDSCAGAWKYMQASGKGGEGSTVDGGTVAVLVVGVALLGPRLVVVSGGLLEVRRALNPQQQQRSAIVEGAAAAEEESGVMVNVVP